MNRIIETDKCGNLVRIEIIPDMLNVNATIKNCDFINRTLGMPVIESICNICGRSWPPDYMFCPRCGMSLTSINYS